MLRVVHGNRFEELAGALIEALPAADPFAPTTIVVSRGLVGTWLTYRIALDRGIAAGLDLPFLDRFLADAYVDADAARVGLSALRRDQLAAVVGSVLADRDRLADPALARVRDYLGDPARPDAPVRRVQLANRVAGLYWGYAMTRPEWLVAWDDRRADGGPATSSPGAADDARWQARLWSLAMETARRGRGVTPRGLGAPAPSAEQPGSPPRPRAEGTLALVPRLPFARRRLGLPAPRLPQPVHVVGFSYLAPAYLDALADLGTAQDVTVYLVDPCADFWEDVASPRARTRVPVSSTADRLLGLWGKPIRDTNAALVERTGGDLDDRFVEPPRTTALACLLADVVARAEPTAPLAGTPAGVTVMACPTVRRELEVVGAEIVRRLAASPTLRAHEVAVLIAGDPDDYLAQLPAVWSSLLGPPAEDTPGSPGLPFHIVDSHLAEHGRVGEAVHALFELPLGRFTRRELLGVMTHPCVLARYKHVDPDDWVQWTERLGIVHGADQKDHRGTYLEHLDLFHWDQGILRLALGGFMCGDRPGQAVGGPVKIAAREAVPEEVADDRQASAATFALLARSLVGDARWLRDRALPLAGWAGVLDAVVTTYVTAPDDAGARELDRIRRALTGLAELDLDGRAVEYREVVELVRHRLAALLGDRGEPLAHGVLVAPLAPMRPLPASLVFVLGLGEGEFPATDPPSPLDLRDPPRAGEVSARDRDRVAFLDAVLAARDHLFLSYVGLDPKSGEPIAPSPVVIELADALAAYTGAASGQAALAALTERHPLHRWDAAYDGGLSASPAPGRAGPDRAGRALVASPAPGRARERRSVLLREAITRHLRARGVAQPEPARLRELVARTPALAAIAHDLRLDPVGTIAGAPDDDAPVRLSLAMLRKFLDAPVQAWAAAVLRLGDLPDEELVDKSDEPFGHDAVGRAAVLRDTLAAVLGVGAAPASVADAYAAAIDARARRGAAPVGVFGEVAGEADRALVETWREAITGAACGPARRVAFGRSFTGDAALEPPIAIDVDLGGRTRRIELDGQTEILVDDAGTGTSASIVVIGGKKAARRHTLRGAIDHVALAAAGTAPRTHRTLCLDGAGALHVTEHAAWTPAAARAYLADLVGELLARPHGYLLSLDDADRALAGKPPKITPTRDGHPGSLGFGPIVRAERLDLPADPLGIAKRRLGPLVERMAGDHGFNGSDA
jgi:exodeoxyribonuclease V gamma subunit